MDNKELLAANNKCMSKQTVAQLIDDNFRIIKNVEFLGNIVLLHLLDGQVIELEIVEEC